MTVSFIVRILFCTNVFFCPLCQQFGEEREDLSAFQFSTWKIHFPSVFTQTGNSERKGRRREVENTTKNAHLY